MPPRSRKRETDILIPSKRFKGVFWDPEKEVWRVRVKLDEDDNGGTAQGGSSLSEEEAARMADECVLELKPGKVLHLNYPEDEEPKIPSL